MSVTRPIDNLGRVVVPREIIKNLGWSMRTDTEDGTKLEFNVVGNKVVISEYKQTCNCCNQEATTEFYGIKLCEGHLRLIVVNAEKILKAIKAK